MTLRFYFGASDGALSKRIYQDVIERSVMAIREADLLIVGGTSLVVYPAAGFVNYFRGSKLVLINKSSTSFDNRADLVIHDAIGKVMKEAVDGL